MRRTLAAAAAAGPALWALTLVTGYSVAERGCQEAGRAPALVWLLPWIALAGTCVAGLLSARPLLRSRRGRSSLSESEHVLASMALGSSLLFAVAITAQGVAPAVLHGCG